MKINKILLAFALLMTMTGSVVAQTTTSPYSMYGYGIINDRATSMQRQMGGIGYALNNGRQINVMNPASYAAVDSLTFLWDMGADLSLLWSKDGEERRSSAGGGLDYITMLFPVTKYLGVSLGLVPYTSVGYSFGNTITHGTKANKGSGGINEAYLGVGGTYAGFSLGANIAYDFGNIQNDSYTYPGETQTLFEQLMRIRDWNLTIGAQYTYSLSKGNRLTLGVTYNPKKSLHGTVLAATQELTQSTKPDTIAYTKMGGKYYQPNTIGVGLNFTHEKTSRFLVEVDFTYQDWAKAKYEPLRNDEGGIAFQGMEFNNRYKIAVGGEFVPRIRGNYGQRIQYRLGAYYTRDYIKIGNNSVKEYGVACGVGLPTPEGKTIINIGLEWKRRMASPVALITENYLNITVGVNFNELWFWKREIQ